MDETKRTPDWAAIRHEYEGRLFPPAVICRRHGITSSQLRYRREQEDWLPLKARTPRKNDLVARMLRILEGQSRDLEKATDMPIDKRTKMLSEQVKILDTLIKRGAAERNVEPPSRKDMTDLRAKLVERIVQYKSR